LIPSALKRIEPEEKRTVNSDLIPLPQFIDHRSCLIAAIIPNGGPAVAIHAHRPPGLRRRNPPQHLRQELWGHTALAVSENMTAQRQQGSSSNNCWLASTAGRRQKICTARGAAPPYLSRPSCTLLRRARSQRACMMTIASTASGLIDDFFFSCFNHYWCDSVWLHTSWISCCCCLFYLTIDP
jgi:hypothetical protein